MISPLRLSPHLAILRMLVVTSGCTEWSDQRMNDLSRDTRQQPKTVLHALPTVPGLRVADLGAGGASFTWCLAEAVGPAGIAYAADVGDTALHLGEQKRAQRLVANVELVRATPTDAPLPVSGMDLIFACNTDHHLLEQIAYCRSPAFVLRPGGSIAVSSTRTAAWLFGHATPKETVLREMEAVPLDSGIRLFA